MIVIHSLEHCLLLWLHVTMIFGNKHVTQMIMKLIENFIQNKKGNTINKSAYANVLKISAYC